MCTLLILDSLEKKTENSINIIFADRYPTAQYQIDKENLSLFYLPNDYFQLELLISECN